LCLLDYFRLSGVGLLRRSHHSGVSLPVDRLIDGTIVAGIPRKASIGSVNESISAVIGELGLGLLYIGGLVDSLVVGEVEVLRDTVGNGRLPVGAAWCINYASW
jgi:hypothetical protein